MQSLTVFNTIKSIHVRTDKDIIDEEFFRTLNIHKRLILGLMAQGGMRISEVHGLTSLKKLTGNIIQFIDNIFYYKIKPFICH
jgi:site-specific recombinase XerC